MGSHSDGFERPFYGLVGHSDGLGTHFYGLGRHFYGLGEHFYEVEVACQ